MWGSHTSPELEPGTVRIVTHKFGDVNERFVERVLGIMSDCYERIKTHAVKIVDLYIFDRSSKMNAFLSEEKRKLGIKTSDFETSFFALHDVWRGIPRIMISYDRMSDTPELVGVGGLRHEVAHAVLHGSLEYYSFPVPTSLVELGRGGIVSRQMVGDLLYLVSVAVKDYEATRLLYRNGFVEDQVAYNKYFLEPSKEDYAAWELARWNRDARLLVLVSLLKTACCAAPLVKDVKYGEEIAETIAKSMSYLPSELSACLLKILEEASKFGWNTHENVDLFAKKIIDELVIETERENF